MTRKHFALLFALVLIMGLLSGCGTKDQSASTSEEPVVLTVAGGWTDCKALDVLANAFTAEYPNCTVNYEYIQDYYPSLQKRMSGEAPVDLFFTTNIQADSEMLPYALDLNSRDDLDLSQTFGGLIENFTFREANVAEGQSKLYAIPLGAEMRGLYVNKTLLASLGLEVPTDQASLLAACQVLKDKGYIPLQSNPGDFGQMLLYPWVCNIIANADDPQAAYDQVNAHEAGVSELFREPFAFLYALVENYYYDYKTAQTDLGYFNETTDEAYAQYFLNIKNENGAWVKADDVGQIAFMPSPMSFQRVLDKAKEDYHSQIEYEFIMSPVGEDGGYAYMSPAHGIAANKDSANLDWSVKFLNFLFQPENNKLFTEAFNVIPNTKEAFDYISDLYAVPDNHISQLGQVTFDYDLYSVISANLVTVSKANNPKYMQDDGSGNLSLYPLEYYMKELENSFQQQ